MTVEPWLEAARTGEVQRAIVQGYPLPVILHDHDTLYYANPAAIKLFGARSLDELVGRNIFEFAAVGHEDLARERVALVFERDFHVRGASCKMATLDGRELSCMITGYPMHALGRDLVLAVVISTER